MTNIVATSISNNITAAEKATIRTNIDLNKGVRDHDAYIASILDKATLDLNFVTNIHKVHEPFGLTSKLLTDVITTARSTTATYQSPTGIASCWQNTPRIAYDPTTGAALGLLCEEARTNLALQSQDFATTWLQSPGASVDVTSNSITAPDGTLTADKFIEADTANTFHDLYQTISYTAGITYCFSVYLKAGERSKVSVFYGATGAFTTERRITVDLVAKTFTIGGTGATGGMIELPNGWFRVWITGAADVTGVTPTIIRLLDATGTVIYPGVVNSGLHVWGAQVEIGGYPSSYIPTTTIALQRQPDVISRALTTTNANAGSIFIEFDLTSYDKASGQAAIAKLVDSGNSGNRGFALVLNNNIYSAYIRNASTSGSISIAVADSLLPVKALVSFDNSTLKLLVAINGVTNEITLGAAIDLTGFVSHLFLAGASGMAGTSTTHNKTVKRCTYVPRSFTAAEAQAITL